MSARSCYGPYRIGVGFWKGKRGDFRAGGFAARVSGPHGMCRNIGRSFAVPLGLMGRVNA